MNKTKKQIGAKLIHKTGRIGTVIEVNENSLTLEFDDGSMKIYSFSTINSKFSLLDENECSVNDVQCSKNNNEQNELEELKKTVKALTKLVDTLNQRLEKLESDRAEEHKVLENLKYKLEKLKNNNNEYETLKNENENPKKELVQLSQEQASSVKEKTKIGRPSRYKNNVVQEIQKLKLEGKTYREIAATLGCSIGYISSKLNAVQEQCLKEKIKIGRPSRYKDNVAREMQKLKLEGKTYREISAILGCSIGYISSKLKSL